MKVLVIGSGGREHALVWKLKQSSRVSEIFCAPGNAGVAAMAKCVAIDASDVKKLLKFARDNKIDLTVVGPEAPLTLGVVDQFEKAGLRIFGPSQKAAAMEGSKVFSKNLMREVRNSHRPLRGLRQAGRGDGLDRQGRGSCCCQGGRPGGRQRRHRGQDD